MRRQNIDPGVSQTYTPCRSVNLRYSCISGHPSSPSPCPSFLYLLTPTVAQSSAKLSGGGGEKRICQPQWWYSIGDSNCWQRLYFQESVNITCSMDGIWLVSMEGSIVYYSVAGGGGSLSTLLRGTRTVGNDFWRTSNLWREQCHGNGWRVLLWELGWSN